MHIVKFCMCSMIEGAVPFIIMAASCVFMYISTDRYPINHVGMGSCREEFGVWSLEFGYAAVHGTV